MNEINSPAQLKASARNSLNGHYPFLILVLITSSVIVMLFSALPPVASLIMQLFTFHICRIYLMTFHGEKTTIMDLFIGNPDRAKEMQTIYAACIITLIQYLCMLPSNLLSLTVMKGANSIIFLLYCITLTAGTAVYFYVYLSLFPIYYLVTDCPAETITETMKMAFFISKGHRFRLFYLMAGFLPLFLLSMLSFGIGLLWVVPYMQATLTYYYLNLTANKSMYGH